jgi:hypothetical protein
VNGVANVTCAMVNAAFSSPTSQASIQLVNDEDNIGNSFKQTKTNIFLII